MRRSRKLKESNKEVLGIIIISISILYFISLFSNKTGAIGILIKNIFLQLMGFGAYIFPFVIFLIGILFVANKLDIDDDRKSFSLLVIFLCVITILDIKLLNTDSFLTRLKLSIKNSKVGLGGGIIGTFFGYIFSKLLGTVGSYIILISLILINTLIVTDIKLGNLINKFKRSERNDKIKKSKKNCYKKNKRVNSIINSNDLSKEDKKIKILDLTKNSFTKNNHKKDSYKITYNDEDISTEFNSHKKSNIGNYKFPPIELLKDKDIDVRIDDKKEIITNAKKIEETIKSFGIEANIIQISKGPTITCYELQPARGVKVSKIVNLSDDIALNLASSDIRIQAPIPGKAAVGIEVPNKNKIKVNLREILSSNNFKEINTEVPFALGINISGKPIVTNIEDMPHLLIAGATGSGKSVCINTIIMSILYKSTPDKVKLLMIDPKVVELNVYNGIPHLLIPVVTDPKKAKSALGWAVEEMTRRYKLFAKNNVRDIYGYNNKVGKQNTDEQLCRIVIIIDELADLMMVSAQEVEDCICRIAQMARAAGMYLIIATQRPSVDIITGTIKANIPSRISFAVTSQADSRTILDMGGAEKLLGRGDMLYYPSGASKPMRVQGAYVDEEEVENVVKFLKSQNTIEYNDSIIQDIQQKSKLFNQSNDELFPQAIKIVVNEGQASISLLQRKLRIGYARAARLIDQMEESGIVEGHQGSKPRKVLIDKENINF